MPLREDRSRQRVRRNYGAHPHHYWAHDHCIISGAFLTHLRSDQKKLSILSSAKNMSKKAMAMIIRAVRRAFARSRTRMVMIVMATVLPAAAIIVHTGNEINVVVEDATRTSASLSARELRLRVREIVESSRASLSKVASLKESRDNTGAACAAWLTKAKGLVREPEYLFLVDGSGRMLCQTKSHQERLDFAQRPFFARAVSSREVSLGAFQHERTRGNPSLAMALPVQATSGAPITVIVYGLTAQSLLSDYAQGPHLPAGSIVALFDQGSDVVASVPESADLGGQRRTVFEDAIASHQDFIAQPDWIDNVPRLTAFSRLEGIHHGLVAAVALPSSAIRTTGEEENQRNLVILAAVSTIVLFIGWTVMQRFIVARAGLIANTADRIAGGDLSARTGIGADGGELGGICGKIDQMAEAFQRFMTSAEAQQDALRRANRALRLFGEVNRMVGKAEDPVQLAQAACRAAVTVGGYSMACIRLHGEELRRIIRVTSCSRSESGLIEELDVKCPSEDCPFAASPMNGPAQVAIRRQIFTAQDVLAHCPGSVGCGGRTAIGVPLVISNVPGTIVVVAPDDTAFDGDEARYIDESTVELSFAMTAILEQQAHRQTRAALDLRDRAIEASRNGIVIFEYGETNRIVSVNPAVQQLLGIEEQPTSNAFREISRPHYDELDWQALCALIDSRREGKVAVTFLHSGDQELRLDVSLTLVGTFEHGPLYGVLEIRNVTDQFKYEAQLAHQSSHDPLTSLANRNLLHDRLGQALARTARGAGDCFAVWVDLDRFQIVHHSLGRPIADAVVIEVAHRLSSVATNCDTVARVADDEFVLVVNEPSSDEAVASLAYRLLEAIRAPMQFGDHELTLTASIGVARSAPDGLRDANALLRCAKTAVFHAKKDGGDSLRFYEPEMSERAERRMRLESALRHALERSELSLVFQPKVDLLTGELTGCEALCRWQHVELGAVPPAEFIAVAEESGLIPFIGRWVMEAACRQARAWLDKGIDCRRMAVNVSALQFAKSDLVADVGELLARYRLSPSMLMIEITETSLMQNPTNAIATLHKLKSIGVMLAIDDFGTGYSSLASLRQFPIDYLKIDRSFVQELEQGANGASIAVSVISLAHNLELRVIAEGVETEGQMAYLRGRGCDEMQGYLFSGPLDSEALAGLLRSGRRIEFPPQFDLPERTLLLVDDEASVQAALRRILRRQGYTVLYATSASEALETLASRSVGVIISDFRMPGMDGIQLLQKVSTLYPEVVRILLSGYADVETVTSAINFGSVFRFMHKPWDDRHLLEAIRQGFERFELARAATV